MVRIKKIYFMGIKGVGMATLAVIAKEAGFVVAGSDVEEEFITDKILTRAGIDIRIGFKTENPEDFFATNPKEECLFIATAAHEGFNNVETEWAKDNNIKVVSHGEAVGLFMSGELFNRKLEGVSVSGSHGKTTISAMIALSLFKLGVDPSFTVGTSEILGFGAAGHYGQGKCFIAEADEYLAEPKFDRIPKFLHQHPKYLIINNIDFDHPDFFENLESVINAYRKFVASLDSDSVLIINGDDENVKKIRNQKSEIKTITYGTDIGNEVVIKNFRQEGFGSHFEVLRKGISLGDLKLSIPGYHNAKNSLSVIVLLMELGFSVRDIQRVLPEFKGAKRRLEKIGETKDGVLIFDDYAHHPEEIRKTLEALRPVFPNKKIIVVFQAHTYSRTQAMIDSFAASFIGASEIIILPTFASARDKSLHTLDEDQKLVDKIRIINPHARFIETKQTVIEYVRQNVKGSDKIVITMGAGDVYKIGEKLKVES